MTPKGTTENFVPSARSKIHMLHVEDDEIDAMLTRKAVIRQMAEEMPDHLFCIDLAPSLRIALQKITEKHYDIVLLDLALTDTEGLNTLHAIKEQGPDLPVVVLTGRCDSNMAVKAVAVGADDYIMKVQMGDPAFAKSILRALDTMQAGRQGAQDAIL